jgi:hypothetical protein
MHVTMKAIAATTLGISLALVGRTAWAAEPPKKNWTAPAEKIYAQALVNDAMSKHPELISITLHGVPPGMTDVYTMFAGSFPDRIGNPDDPDDIDVSKKGITILDPRWRRAADNPKKFVVLLPMRDASGENVGEVVYAFKQPTTNPNATATEKEYLDMASSLRDGLAKQIPNYQALFRPAQ